MTRALIITVAVATGIALTAATYNFLLLTLGAILFGTLLFGFARWFQRWLHLSHGWSLTAVTVIFLVICAGFWYLLGTQIADQISQYSDVFPKALHQIVGYFNKYPWAKRLAMGGAAGGAGGGAGAGGAIGLTREIISDGGRFIAAVLYVFFAGLFVAANPPVYREAFVRLLPEQKQAPMRQILDYTGEQLWIWVLVRIVVMIFIGAATTLELWLLNIPMALSLGFLAGILLFIPYVGSVVAAIPAILLALTQSFEKAVWVTLVYIGIHILEGYIVSPLLQKRALRLPPGATLIAEGFMGILCGILGILFSTPLLLIGIILTQKIYIEDRLNFAETKSSPDYPRKAV